MKKYPFYIGDAQGDCAEEPAELLVLKRDRRHEAEARFYKAEPGLVDAVNVALLLGQPLLLTGEPGTGKTQLAYSLGCQLGHEVLKFDTKSTSIARDLFFTYNTLGHFHVAQLKVGNPDGKDFIDYNALGIAILRSREKEEVKEWLPDRFEHGGRQRSIVLIDEIDKAPRDFPNDLLNQIEQMYFSVPELGTGNKKIMADEQMRPIVVITSNSEKSLPDAFLRRCIFYNISFPEDPKRLEEIVLAHLVGIGVEPAWWLRDALDFFIRLREPRQNLEKPPATAELLNWLMFLHEERAESAVSLRKQPKIITSSFGTLLKNTDDWKSAASLLETWQKE